MSKFIGIRTFVTIVLTVGATATVFIGLPAGAEAHAEKLWLALGTTLTWLFASKASEDRRA